MKIERVVIVKKLMLAGLVLLITLIPSFCVAEIRIEEFQKAQGVVYKYDDMTETLSVTPDFEVLDLMVDGKAIIQPIILTNDVGGKPVYLLTLYFVSVSEKSISPTSAIIKTDAHRYFVTPVAGSIDTTYTNGRYIDGMFYYCGDVGIKMIEDILASTNVKIRIDGTSDVDFDLSENQRTALSDMYSAYKSAGCTEQELSTYDLISPITIK